MIVFLFQLAFRFGRSSHDCMFFSASFQIWEKSSHDCMIVCFSASFQIRRSPLFQIWEKSSHDCMIVCFSASFQI